MSIVSSHLFVVKGTLSPIEQVCHGDLAGFF